MAQTTIKPQTRDELVFIIKDTIEKEGVNCNLNFIDTSDITNMSQLFYNSKFNGDISKWNTSNVKDMYAMFEDSQFNGDISAWDTSNVMDMEDMFKGSILEKEHKLPEWYVN